MRVWEALGMDSWKWVAIGTHPQGVAVWVQDAGGRMDIGIWDGDSWALDSNWLQGPPTHWRAIRLLVSSR